MDKLYTPNKEDLKSLLKELPLFLNLIISLKNDRQTQLEHLNKEEKRQLKKNGGYINQKAIKELTEEIILLIKIEEKLLHGIENYSSDSTNKEKIIEILTSLSAEIFYFFIENVSEKNGISKLFFLN